jgi:ABC-type transport system involved in Fe-S cluster assembly fused permease/ATPase subunit
VWATGKYADAHAPQRITTDSPSAARWAGTHADLKAVNNRLSDCFKDMRHQEQSEWAAANPLPQELSAGASKVEQMTAEHLRMVREIRRLTKDDRFTGSCSLELANRPMEVMDDKTTLVNLLVRFYEIDAGRISLDGTDYAELTRDEVRRAFGMVLQDTWLFAGTIADNIAYGKAGATDEEIVDAATAAYVDHFVRTLPDGYDTRLDADASNFSSGQKQLLTIARAFLASPPILILDEATSNVDTRTEVLIQEAMARLRQGRTSFVIAHRLSTIRNADTIIVMDDGRIVEHGNHADLLERRGLYYSLYNSQFTEAFNAVV